MEQCRHRYCCRPSNRCERSCPTAAHASSKKVAFDHAFDTTRHAKLLAKYGQFGAGIRAGVEAASRGLRLLHESDVDSCTWSKDIYNAFQELSRQAIHDTLREFDYELCEYFVA